MLLLTSWSFFTSPTNIFLRWATCIFFIDLCFLGAPLGCLFCNYQQPAAKSSLCYTPFNFSLASWLFQHLCSYRRCVPSLTITATELSKPANTLASPVSFNLVSFTYWYINSKCDCDQSLKLYKLCASWEATTNQQPSHVFVIYPSTGEHLVIFIDLCFSRFCFSQNLANRPAPAYLRFFLILLNVFVHARLGALWQTLT